MGTYRFELDELRDGRFRVTSPDLPGFRLLLSKDNDMDKRIIAAFNDFIPIYLTAQAKEQADKMRPRIRQVSRDEFELEVA